MSVRIGKIELSGVQDLHTEEARTLVEQRVPEQQGSVFQDLGREPVTILIDGLLFGEESLSALETLRQAHAKAEPQSFAADLVVGTDLTDVIIEDFKVRQVAGYKDRYRFSLRLREHIEAPEASGAAMADVNAQVSADGAAWGDASLAAAGVLQDPASLPAALAANPALLDNLDMDALGDAVAGNLDKLDTGQLNGMLDTLAAADPAKAGGLIDALGQVVLDRQPTLLIAYDSEYPEPLFAKRPVPDVAGVALLLTPERCERSLASISVTPAITAAEPLADPVLESLRLSIPALRALPLLQKLARGEAGKVCLDYLPPMQLQVDIGLC